LIRATFVVLFYICHIVASADTQRLDEDLYYPNELLASKDVRFTEGTPKVVYDEQSYSWQSRATGVTEIWAKDRTYALEANAVNKKLSGVTEMALSFSDLSETTVIFSQTYEIVKGSVKSSTLCEIERDDKAFEKLRGNTSKAALSVDPQVLQCWTLDQEICKQLRREGLPINKIFGADGDSDYERPQGDETVRAAKMIEECKGIMGLMESVQAFTFKKVNEQSGAGAQAAAVAKVKSLYSSKISEGKPAFRMENKKLEVGSLSKAREVLELYGRINAICDRMTNFKTGNKPQRPTGTPETIRFQKEKSPAKSRDATS